MVPTFFLHKIVRMYPRIVHSLPQPATAPALHWMECSYDDFITHLDATLTHMWMNVQDGSIQQGRLAFLASLSTDRTSRQILFQQNTAVIAETSMWTCLPLEEVVFHRLQLLTNMALDVYHRRAMVNYLSVAKAGMDAHRASLRVQQQGLCFIANLTSHCDCTGSWSGVLEEADVQSAVMAAVAAMTAHAAVVSVQELGVSILSVLVNQMTNVAIIGQIIEAVTSALQAHCASKAVAMFGLTVLKTISETAKVDHLLAGLLLPDAVPKAMRAHGPSAPLQSQGLCLMANLSGNAHNESALLAYISCVVQPVMRDHAACAALQLSALCILRNLSTNNAHEVTLEACVPFALSSMAAHLSNCALQEEGLAFLSNMTAYHVCVPTVVPTTLAAMRAHSSQENVQCHGVSVLNNVAMRAKDGCRVLFPVALDEIINALRKHLSAKTSLATDAMELLARLSSEPGHASHIALYIPDVVVAMCMQPHCEPVQINACEALSNLARHVAVFSDSAAASPPLKDAGGLSLLADTALRDDGLRYTQDLMEAVGPVTVSMRVHHMSAGLQATALAFLANLACQACNRSRLVTHAECAAWAMRTHVNSEDTQVHALGFLSNLAQSPEYKFLLMAAAVDVVLSMCTHVFSETIQESGFHVLTNLAVSATNAPPLMKAFHDTMPAFAENASCADVTLQWLSFVTNLAIHNTDNAPLVAAAVPAMTAMRANLHIEPLQERGLGFLLNLHAYGRKCLDVHGAQVVSVATDAMQAHPNHVDVQELGIRLLSALLKFTTAMPAKVITPHVARALRVNKHSKTIQDLGRALLRDVEYAVVDL